MIFKIFKKFIIIFFFCFPVYAENIGIVDVAFLINNSKAGKFIQKTLKDENTKVIENLKKKEIDLKNQEKKLISQKNVLSEEEFSKKISDYRKKINDHNTQKKIKLDDLNKKKATGVAKLLENLNTILIEFSKNNNLELIIDKKYTILSKNEMDFTKEVLELLDKKVSKINF